MRRELARLYGSPPTAGGTCTRPRCREALPAFPAGRPVRSAGRPRRRPVRRRRPPRHPVHPGRPGQRPARRGSGGRSPSSSGRARPGRTPPYAATPGGRAPAGARTGPAGRVGAPGPDHRVGIDRVRAGVGHPAGRHAAARGPAPARRAMLLEHPSVYTAASAPGRGAADRRHAGGRRRPRRADHLARAGSAGRLPDRRAGRAGRRGGLRAAAGGGADRACAPGSACPEPCGSRPLRGVVAGRRAPAGTQDRRDRRPGRRA